MNYGSSSGADSRGHVRGESVAVKRGPGSSPLKPSSSPASPPSVRAAGAKSAHSDVTETQRHRQRRSTILKAAALLGLLFVVAKVAQPALSSRNVARQARFRKARLGGRGESFVLPKKWRDDPAASYDGLPVCKRVLLFRFSPSSGFSSEIFLYLRAAVVAQKLGYTLLADDEDWNYGGLRDYFLPKQIHCRPPPDWFLRTASNTVPLGSKRWTGSDRVWYSREIAEKADDWVREEMLDPSAIEELKEKKFGHILPEGETLPGALEEVYNDFAAAAKELFARPNDQLATMIRKQRMELGLGEGGLRHRKNSPTWGGNRRPGSANERQAVEELPEEEHDFDEAGGAERSDRGPIIGAHFRLGDKSRQWKKEVDLVGASTQAYGNRSVFAEGALDSVRRLSKSSIAEPSYTRGRNTLFPSHSTPTIVVMTAEGSIVSSLESDSSIAERFKIRITSPPTIESLRQWKDVLNLDATDDSVVQPAVLTTFTQAKFNELPASLRVHLTRYFLRDLITLSLYADAFIVSGASHLGRLACLIAGEDAVVGPRDISGRGLGGRVRSIDIPWIPTAVASSLFSS